MTSSLNTSVTKTLTVRNLGHASLTVGPAAISGQDLSQFSVDQQPGSPVAPGGYTTLVVKFLPTSSGNKTALLSIPSNDPDENPYVITLSGYCEPHMDVLEVGPGETYDFGTVLIGEYAEATFKVSSIDKCLEETSDQEPAHFTFRAAVPDMAAQVSRVANVSFGAGRVSGAENLLFNNAVAEIPAEDPFLGVWHHACVRYDMRSYTGSVWIDERPILSGISLNTETLGPEATSRVGLDKTRDISVSLWIDDMEVGFLDLNDAPLRIEPGSYGRLFRDRFDKYENSSLLAEGGWRIAAPNVDLTSADPTDAPGGRAKETGGGKLVPKETAAGLRVLLDDSQFTSKPRAMRLEPEAEEPSHSIAKQVSFPVRVPFAVSSDSFSIVEEAAKVATTSLTKSTLTERDDAREISMIPGFRRSLTRERRDRSTGLIVSSGENPGGGQPTSGETAKVMSASPAGGSFYIYSFDGRLLAEYNLYGQCVRDYIYMGAQLVAEYQPSTSLYYYYTSDQINSTRMVTDDAGAVVYSAAHDPYGGIQRTWVNAFEPALKFSGKERDGESGLDYFGARYYDKSQYRFISVDPVVSPLLGISNPQYWNLYSYCGDNPVAYSDPNGESFLVFIAPCNLLVFDISGRLKGVFWASSHVVGGHTPIPQGRWWFSHYRVDANAAPGDKIDELGFYGFYTIGANPSNSKGVHAGYDGQWGANTEGCIRTTRSAMNLINSLHLGGDPVNFLIVITCGIDSNGFIDCDAIIGTVAFYLKASGKDNAFIARVERALGGYLDRVFGPLNFLYDYFMNSESPVPAYDY